MRTTWKAYGANLAACRSPTGSEACRVPLRVVAAHGHALMREALAIALAGSHAVTLVAVTDEPGVTADVVRCRRPDVALLDEALVAAAAPELLGAIAGCGCDIILFGDRATDPVWGAITASIPKTIWPCELATALLQWEIESGREATAGLTRPPTLVAVPDENASGSPVA
jgi:hypothetical protein